MIFLSIAHNETPTVRVDNILPLETGRGVEADGFEFVQCFGDSETLGQLAEILTERFLVLGTDYPRILWG